MNFWVFSRFTVDDAFITWRYGKNLIEHGVWNYNPTTFDPTQAYTNPIFAALSILPAFFGMNEVLFFKLFSLVGLIAFVGFFIRRRPEASLPLAIFFAVPATMIHVFSGLETFIYVALIFVLLLAVKNDEVGLATIVTLALMVTRPEAILLLGLVPLFLSANLKGAKLEIQWGRLIKIASVLFAFAVFVFWLNISLFGEALPNTFFVKSGQYFFNGTFFVWLLALIPLIPLMVLKLWRVVGLGLAFSLPVIYNYSTSYLAMDYASRFAFQVYAPLALLAIYVLALKENRARLASLLSKYRIPKISLGFLAPLLAIGLVIPSTSADTLSLATYYPKLQAVHGELGRAVNILNGEGLVSVTAMGDAGLFPYEANVPNLDIRKLGTHLGAVNGMTRELVEQYRVDFAVIPDYTVADSVLRPYVIMQKMTHVCDAHLSDTYMLEIWMKKADSRIQAICDSSKRYLSNAVDYSGLVSAPWTDWR